MSAAARCLMALVLGGLGLTLGGCEKTMRDMYDQPKLETFESSPLFADGASARDPVAGTVAVEDADAGAKPPTDLALLRRGRERFNIYCAPCHSPAGDGDGMVPRRGFPSPPSFHDERLRNADDALFYEVISNGYGVMYPYASRIPPRDRWAIVAYIRALQLARHARLADAPPQERARLEAAPVDATAPEAGDAG